MRFDELDLELFRQIIEAGSITHGAQRLNLALTAASARMRNLEDRLGVRLLERHRYGVSPTLAGHAFLNNARDILQQTDRLREEMSLYRGGAARHVRLATNTNAYTRFLPDRLGQFLIEHPHIDVLISEASSETIIGLIVNGKVEIGIIAKEPDVGGLVSLPFGSDQYVVVTAASHALAKREAVSFSQILDQLFVAGPTHWLFVRKAQLLGRQIRARIRLREDAHVCQLAAKGCGIGIVPLSVASFMAQSLNLSIVKMTDAWAERSMFVCVRSIEELAQPAKLLFEHLGQQAA